MRLPVVAVFFCALFALLAQPASAQNKKPAVLFTSRLHLTYFAQPLHADGIELHICSAGDLPTLLPTGKYNVVVVHGEQGDPKVAAALKEFMTAGGGVLAFPDVSWDAGYLPAQHFLEGFGAHYTVSLINDADPARMVKAMFCNLYATETIAAPFNAGVPGLLYLAGSSQSGISCPVSLAMDANWTPVVKASPTAKAVAWDTHSKDFMPYMPAQPETAPTLLATRTVGAGRLAAIGITSEWVFQSPTNCPPVEDMLTRGRDGKPSNWIHLYANLFRWLAAPTLAAGKGGTPTMSSALQPPPASAALAGWADEMLKPRDWTKAPAMDDQEQLPGLIGARSSYSGGKATVAEWVNAAKAAGLKYLVFLEPLEFITEENFNKFKADCAKYSDDTFFACPGLWGKDAYTKTSMYTYGENVQYPVTTCLTADKKMFNDPEGLPKVMRTKYIFDYFFEQLGYKGQFGYFRHKENTIPPWEYKMNNTFVVYSTENGTPLDDGSDAFSYLQATDFCYTPTAFSLMDDPSQLARALHEDWRVVNTAPGEFGDGTYTAEYGQGVSAMRKLFTDQIAWVRPYQYITQGPTINCWRGRWEIVIPFSEWYRPDQWRYRVRLHVTSDAGLKEIVVMSAGKVAFRFLPNGAKAFDKTFDFENSQQRAMYPIITDMNGKRAIGSYVRNSNTLWNEFICGDRCNYLAYGLFPTSKGQWHQVKPGSNAVTQNKGGWMAQIAPSTTLTVDYPTLPIDGAPQGDKTPSFPIFPGIATPDFPDTVNINNHPKWVAAGPDVIIGGGDVDNVLTDQASWGDAWAWWSPVKPNPFITGYGLHTAFGPLPEAMRCGWYEFNLRARKELPLTNATMPINFTYAEHFTELRTSEGKVYKTGDKDLPATGAFKHGAYILVDEVGGPAALYSLDDALIYWVRGDSVSFGKCPAEKTLAKDMPITCKIGYLGAPAGTNLDVLRHYFAVMSAPPIKITGGTLTGDGIAGHIDGKSGAVVLRFDPLALHAYLCLQMDGLQPNWDAWVVDESIKAPNWRQVVKSEGTAYAVLPCDGKKRYFLGHPVMADNPTVKISLCNTLPGQWQLTLHNPTDAPITTAAWTNTTWPVFRLRKTTYTIPAGSSVEVAVRTK